MGSKPTKSRSPQVSVETNEMHNFTFSSQWLQTKMERQITLQEMTVLCKAVKQPLETIDKAFKYLEKRGIIIENGLLGKGDGGFVLRAFSQNNDHLAVKFQRSNSQEEAQKNLREYKILQKFNSPYITKVYNCYNETHDSIDYQFMVMERCMYDLKKFIMKKIKPAQRQKNISSFYSMCNQLAKGLKELHSKNILHLDVKPANILLGLDLKWKYADLGISKMVTSSKQHTSNLISMTAIYSSPEQYQMANSLTNQVTKASDIYSLGIVFLELTGVDISQKWIMKEKIYAGDYSQCLNPYYEEFNNRILKRMIKYDPKERLEIQDVIKILRELKNKRQQECELTDEDFNEINLYNDLLSDQSKNQIALKRQNKNVIKSTELPLYSEIEYTQEGSRKNQGRHGLHPQQLQYSPIYNDLNSNNQMFQLPSLSPVAAAAQVQNHYFYKRSKQSNKQFQSLQDTDNQAQSLGLLKLTSIPNQKSSLIRNEDEKQSRENIFLPQIKSQSSLNSNLYIFFQNPNIQKQQIPRLQIEMCSPQQSSLSQIRSFDSPQAGAASSFSARSHTFKKNKNGNNIFVSHFNQQ